MERRAEQPRYFTLEEANRLLPRVRRLVQALQAQARELTQLQAELAALGEQAGANGHAGRVPQTLARADARLKEVRGLLGEIEAIGCELKDIRMGLVDFRTLRGDRAVYLCWRLGEDAIRYWHELDTGFSGRQPL